MAFTRKQKEATVEKLGGLLKNSETVAFVNFHGLGVIDTTEMRRELAENGVGYTVAKKTLIRKVLGDMNVSGEIPDLDGEVAIAYGSQTEPARGVYEFGKRHVGTLSLLGGIFEGRYVGKDEITNIATIPSLEVLRGMFVNLINSPIQRFAIALSEIAKKS